MKNVLATMIIGSVLMTGCVTEEFVLSEIDKLDKKQKKEITKVSSEVQINKKEITKVSSDLQLNTKKLDEKLNELIAKIEKDVQVLSKKIEENKKENEGMKDVYETLQELVKNLKKATYLHAEGLEKQNAAAKAMISAFEKVSK